MSQPIYLKSLLWDQYFCNLPKKSKSCWNDPMILKGTFMLESPYFLLFRQFPLFRQLDHSIVVPQKLDISDFRGIKYNDATTNSYQFVGAINFEGNSTTTGHYVAYWKCSSRVIKMNDSNIQHYSDNILNSKQFISTSHTLFDISTSCLEPENEVLQEYVLRLPLHRDKFKTLSWNILNQHQSTFISRKSIDLCFIMNLLMISSFIWETFLRYQLSTNTITLWKVSVFSPNVGKYGPEKLPIRTLSMQWMVSWLGKNAVAQYLS